MAIAIKTARVGNISIEVDKDGNEKVSGDYSLISSGDKVLAKQSFNGYSDIKLELSSDTRKALNSFLTGIKKDCLNLLGIEGE